MGDLLIKGNAMPKLEVIQVTPDEAGRRYAVMSVGSKVIIKKFIHKEDAQTYINFIQKEWK